MFKTYEEPESPNEGNSSSNQNNTHNHNHNNNFLLNAERAGSAHCGRVKLK